MPQSRPTRFIILPTRGFVASGTTSAEALNTLFSLQMKGVQRLARANAPRLDVKVLASIHENGPKLVELTAEKAFQLGQAQPGLRIVPEVRFQLARKPQVTVESARKAFPRATLGKVKLRVVLAGTGAGLPDVHVVAFTNVAKRAGAEATTNTKGEVSLALPATTRRLERVYLYASHTAWPMIMNNVAVGSAPIALPVIDPQYIDARSKLAPPVAMGDGLGVRVGVLDTGCGPHADLVVAKGMSIVYGDSDNGFHDTEGHGTHVAGVIAARGARFRGLAPSVSLNVYRVFPRDGGGASNFDIGNAIDTAVADGCDLLNLSMGGGPMDAVTDEAIKSARARGTVCVIAAGNEAGPVSNPGTHPLALCVSAIGAKGTWPKGAVQQEDATSPGGKLKTYMAAFSNTGPEVDLAGTGCGIISTYPDDRFAIMDGTSMACPCATGAIARLLAASPAILSGARDAQRADRIVRLATMGAVDLGFVREMQGAGLRS